MARMEIISGVERRRRWSKGAKLEILAEADQPGVRIGDVARRHDIYPAQIRLWRRVLSPFDAPSSFVPVRLLDEELWSSRFRLRRDAYPSRLCCVTVEV